MYQVVSKEYGKKGKNIIYKDICSLSEAEDKFITAVENRISNFDEYTSCDIQAIKDNRREGYGSGEILIEEV
jgi:hypothetical protein